MKKLTLLITFVLLIVNNTCNAKEPCIANFSYIPGLSIPSETEVPSRFCENSSKVKNEKKYLDGYLIVTFKETESCHNGFCCEYEGIFKEGDFHGKGKMSCYKDEGTTIRRIGIEEKGIYRNGDLFDGERLDRISHRARQNKVFIIDGDGGGIPEVSSLFFSPNNIKKKKSISGFIKENPVLSAAIAAGAVIMSNDSLHEPTNVSKGAHNSSSKPTNYSCYSMCISNRDNAEAMCQGMSRETNYKKGQLMTNDYNECKSRVNSAYNSCAASCY